MLFAAFKTTKTQTYKPNLITNPNHLVIQRKSLKVVILQVQSASSTSVGGGKSPSKGLAKSSSGGGQARQRKGASGAVTRRAPTSAAGGGMWKFYTEDSPGLKVYVYIKCRLE